MSVSSLAGQVVQPGLDAGQAMLNPDAGSSHKDRNGDGARQTDIVGFDLLMRGIRYASCYRDGNRGYESGQ